MKTCGNSPPGALKTVARRGSESLRPSALGSPRPASSMPHLEKHAGGAYIRPLCTLKQEFLFSFQESRIQNSEDRSQNQLAALSLPFWLLAPEFWIPYPAAF